MKGTSTEYQKEPKILNYKSERKSYNTYCKTRECNSGFSAANCESPKSLCYPRLPVAR